MTPKEIEDYKKAGEIAKKIKEFSRKLIKSKMPLLEIAEKIESQILKLGGKIAFPVNLAVNDVAAHFTPSSTSEEKAEGLLCVDIGIHVNGKIADTAFSMDLENSEENKKIIQASQKALNSAIKKIKQNPFSQLNEIGKTIQETISSFDLSPIKNLSGHSLGNYLVHSGITIPNYDNNNNKKLNEGAYAIEPFATSGEGVVYDGGKSNIYRLENQKTPRDKTAREIYNFILKNYETLPFCERWIAKKFPKTKLGLMFLEKEGILHHYPQLVEKSRSKVSQAENTILIHKDGKVEITTE